MIVVFLISLSNSDIHGKGDSQGNLAMAAATAVAGSGNNDSDDGCLYGGNSSGHQRRTSAMGTKRWAQQRQAQARDTSDGHKALGARAPGESDEREQQAQSVGCESDGQERRERATDESDGQERPHWETVMATGEAMGDGGVTGCNNTMTAAP